MSPSNSMPQGTTSRAILVAMALLVLMMPMNYRAGTDTSHPHAFFQEMIDMIVGHTHDHGDSVGNDHEHAHEHADGASHSHDHAHGDEASGPAQTTAVGDGPDLPGVSELTHAAEKANAILILVAMLGAIGIVGWKRRDLWLPERVLLAVAQLVEAPPPRALVLPHFLASLTN